MSLALYNTSLSILQESLFSADDWIAQLNGVSLEDFELGKETALDDIEAMIVAFGDVKEEWTYDFPKSTWKT